MRSWLMEEEASAGSDLLGKSWWAAACSRHCHVPDPRASKGSSEFSPRYRTASPCSILAARECQVVKTWHVLGGGAITWQTWVHMLQNKIKVKGSNA